MTKQNNVLGIFLSVAGYTAWVAGDTFVKLSGQSLPIVEILFIGFFVGFLLTMLIAKLHGGCSQLLTTRPAFHLMRSIFIMGATYGSVAGVIYLSLADFYTIIFTSPLILTILGRVFLKEPVDNKMWLAIFVGFIGVVIAVQFSGATSPHLSWIGIVTTCLASFSLSLTMLTVRSAPNENGYALGFWPQVINCAVLLVFISWQKNIVFDSSGIIFAVLSGIMGAVGVLLTNASLKVAPVAVVSPYHYTQIVGGAIVGYLIWGHIPSWSVVIGAIIITGSGLYILHAETRKRIQPTQLIEP